MSSKKPSIIGIIPARFGSTRLPGKPLLEFEGKPLIQHTYENAKKCKLFDELLVATDDERIKNKVESFGGKAVMTPDTCATGTERLAYVIAEFPDFAHYDIVVNVQGDEPDVSENTIDLVVKNLILHNDASMATACVPLNNLEEINKSSVVKCVFDQKGYALYFSRSPIPSHKTERVNKNIPYHKHIGLYAYRKDFLHIYPYLTSTPLQISEDLEQLKALEHGYKIHITLVDHDTKGIDTPEDYKLRESKICQ